MPAIETNGLIKRYKSLTAVDGLSLSVEQGELFSLLGVNGAEPDNLYAVVEGRPVGTRFSKE